MDPQDQERLKPTLDIRVAVLEAEFRHAKANIEHFKKDSEDVAIIKSKMESSQRLLTIALTMLGILVAVAAILIPHIVWK